MNIINTISDLEVKQIKNISSNSKFLPNQLKEAIIWFYCCLATQRVRKINNPCSMLIHTSQKQSDHESISNAIKTWFNSFDALSFINECKKVYTEQVKKFSKEDFYIAYPNYATKNINDYLPFDKISNEIVSIFNLGIKSIIINENQNVKYSKGVHLCIDNCSHNYIENNEHIRLLYPKEKLDYASGFIVVGGATLSRGLTIEGIVCTYFLRTVKQADTLMQMGRWFGYRLDYELLQRIWMTEATKSQFKFLSVLDYELRNEMKSIQDSGLSPAMVGIKVMRHPRRAFLDITSKNKQKDAIPVEIDFNGISTQTTIFYSDETKLKSNYDNTTNFIQQLGVPFDLSSHIKADNYVWWGNIDNDTVLNYISSLEFPKNDCSFLDVKLFKNWYDKFAVKNGLNKWNVVIAGLDRASEDKKETIGGITVCKVNRSKRITINDGLIRIGALRAPKDWYIDVNPFSPGLDDIDREIIKKSATDSYKTIRKKAGLNDTSLLVIYFINKNSQPRSGEIHREAMNTKIDVIGISLVIPDNASKSATSNSYVSVDLSSINTDLSEIDNYDED